MQKNSDSLCAVTLSVQVFQRDRNPEVLEKVPACRFRPRQARGASAKKRALGRAKYLQCRQFGK